MNTGVLCARTVGVLASAVSKSMYFTPVFKQVEMVVLDWIPITVAYLRRKAL